MGQPRRGPRHRGLIVASLLFAFYVANFGSYNKTYGALGGVVVMLVWLSITNIALLLGMEFNSERERSRELAAGTPARTARSSSSRATSPSPRRPPDAPPARPHGRAGAAQRRSIRGSTTVSLLRLLAMKHCSCASCT